MFCSVTSSNDFRSKLRLRKRASHFLGGLWNNQIDIKYGADFMQPRCKCKSRSTLYLAMIVWIGIKQHQIDIKSLVFLFDGIYKMMRIRYNMIWNEQKYNCIKTTVYCKEKTEIYTRISIFRGIILGYFLIQNVHFVWRGS